MCVIGKDLLERLQREYRLVWPFDPAHFDGDGYVLSVAEDVTINYLDFENVVSLEFVHIPWFLVGYMTTKSKFGRLGLMFSNSAKAHSGFIGRIVLELTNVSKLHKPITISKGEPLIHLDFWTRLGKPSPYDGKYMYQHMSEEEIKMIEPFAIKSAKIESPEKILEIERPREQIRS